MTTNDAAPAVTATPVTATEGTAFGGAVAHFTHVNPNAVAGDFTATIEWGDGSAPDADTTIAPDGHGGFTVSGAHTFDHAGSPDVTVTVAHPEGSTSANDTATATIGYAAVDATLSSISATEGASFAGQVATFTDANTAASASD